MLHRLLTEVVGAVTLGILFEVSVNGLFVVHGVGPHQVTEDAVEWNLLLAIDLVDLIELLKAGRDAAMHRQILLGDVAGDGHRVEDVHEQIVHFGVEALHDFVAERERFCHVARLVIATEQDYILWEVQLDREEEQADFDAEDASIYVVSKEEVVQAAWLACLRYHVEQVSILAMDVSHDADGLINLYKISFVREELKSGVEKAQDLGLCNRPFSRKKVF